MLKACCENTSQNIIIYIYAPAVLNCVASSSSEPFIKLYNTCHMLVHTHTHTHTHTCTPTPPHPVFTHLHTSPHPRHTHTARDTQMYMYRVPTVQKHTASRYTIKYNMWKLAIRYGRRLFAQVHYGRAICEDNLKEKLCTLSFSTLQTLAKPYSLCD